MTIQSKTDVLIAGGGPSGLMLAIELGRRGSEADANSEEIFDHVLARDTR